MGATMKRGKQNLEWGQLGQGILLYAEIKGTISGDGKLWT